MFWDRPLYYTEDPEQPATMIFDTGEMDGTVDTRPLFTTPLLRAAGVTLRLYARTKTEMKRSTVRIASCLGYALTVTHLPALEREIDFSAELYAGSAFSSVSEDTLPVLERELRLNAAVKPGSIIQSVMETPIGGVTIQQ